MSKDIHWKSLRDVSSAARFSQSQLQPKTPNQALYLQSIREKVITICLGVAGTGKTYLPSVLGVEWLLQNKIEKIVLTRPLVTCSASNRDALGILPGDLMEKVGPYMRPLLDVLEGKIGKEEVNKLIYQKKIDVVPLDVMRGLSLSRALIIADEMQNSSMEQIRCLLTRFSEGSKVVVSGDPTQSDLDFDVPPLVKAFHKLKGNRDIGHVLFGREDVVRHPLINFIDERLGSGGGRDFILAPDMASWYLQRCHACQAPNWVDFGDENDPNNPDVDSIECWQCNGMNVWNDEADDFVAGVKGVSGLAVRGCRRPPVG